MDKKTYDKKMAAIAEGKNVTQKTFDELVEFAKAKKLKRPAATAVKAKAVKEPKAPKVKTVCDPSLAGSDEKCEKFSRVGGMCSTHWTRLVYRAQPEKAEKAREASKKYAAGIRAQKAAAKAEAEKNAPAEPELAVAS